MRSHAAAVRVRHRLDDGTRTTVHVAVHRRRGVTLEVAALAPARALAAWCAEGGVEDALVGGFFVTPSGGPLGELWIDGARTASTPFAAPWDAVRACVAVDGDDVRIAGRDALPAAPAGSLLQAGPMLVRDGTPIVSDGDDREGFSAASGQFDSDITQGRHPRAALGIDDERFVAVVCDGRAHDESGLSLAELAGLMAGLGARDAINLDGGGSASLVAGGLLRNRPRAAWGEELAEGRPLATALVFRRRAGAQAAGLAARAA